MFSRSGTSGDRVNKTKKPSKSSFRDEAKQKLRAQLRAQQGPPSASTSAKLNSPIVTIMVGEDRRLFAAHEDVLCRSPFFADACISHSHQLMAQRIALVDEDPEIFSAVLEYLYKGDYYPRLLHDRKRNAWVLEDKEEEDLSPKVESGRGNAMSAMVFSHRVGDSILRDTAVYCSAERFGLDELKNLALRKQGLHTGIDVGTILRTARYAYENTPESESRLRAHFLALIIRSRKTFKRSGTMQAEMEAGGKMFFDLFVAMCNHVDDVLERNN